MFITKLDVYTLNSTAKASSFREQDMWSNIEQQKLYSCAMAPTTLYSPKTPLDLWGRRKEAE